MYVSLGLPFNCTTISPLLRTDVCRWADWHWLNNAVFSVVILRRPRRWYVLCWWYTIVFNNEWWFMARLSDAILHNYNLLCNCLWWNTKNDSPIRTGCALRKFFYFFFFLSKLQYRSWLDDRNWIELNPIALQCPHRCCVKRKSIWKCDDQSMNGNLKTIRTKCNMLPLTDSNRLALVREETYEIYDFIDNPIVSSLFLSLSLSMSHSHSFYFRVFPTTVSGLTKMHQSQIRKLHFRLWRQTFQLHIFEWISMYCFWEINFTNVFLFCCSCACWWSALPCVACFPGVVSFCSSCFAFGLLVAGLFCRLAELLHRSCALLSVSVGDFIYSTIWNIGMLGECFNEQFRL